MRKGGKRLALGSLKSRFLTIGLAIEEQRRMGGFDIPDATIPDDCYDDGLVCEGLTWPKINALVKRKKAFRRLISAKRIRNKKLIKSAKVFGYDIIGEVCTLFIYTVIYTTLNILYCDFMCVPRND